MLTDDSDSDSDVDDDEGDVDGFKTYIFNYA